MRVLVATRYRNVLGGVETYLKSLLPALVASGHEVALVHDQPVDLTRPVIDSEVPEIPLWDVSQSQKLPAQLGAWRPDVVYSHGLQGPALEEALMASWPTVLYAHNYDGACISGSKRQSFPEPAPCQRTLGVGCLWRYLPCRCGGLNPLSMLKLYQVNRRRQETLSGYRAVLVASRHMQQEYSRHGVSNQRLQVVPLFPPGITPDLEPPQPRPLSGQVLMVGRLTNLKGGEYLIEALAVAKARWALHLHLVVAGDGPERSHLEALAQRRGVPAQFLGWTDGAECQRRMRRADLLAVPSTWPEPFGLVGIEAGCVGLPAVAYAVGGIADWLIAGESGELAPGHPPRPEALAEALRRATQNPEHLHRLRCGAWRTARRFTQENHLRLLQDVLERAAVPVGSPLPR